MPQARSTLRLSAFLLTLLVGSASSAAPLRVVATTPDLGDLARIVGGDDVEVTTLVKGPQDPHRIEPRPSFIQKLHRADLFVEVGMELERAWVPPLLVSARNPRILPGGEGYVDASGVIAPLEVPPTSADRSMGDVHPYGNPHYLTDPVNGVRVAALLRDRMAELRPGAAAALSRRYDAFARDVAAHLVGEAALAQAEPETVLRAVEDGSVDAALGGARLGGWLGTLADARGTPVVEDHQYWIYFTRRFGFEIVERLEPRPGIAPTTRHLSDVVALVRARGVPLTLTTTYFDPRHALRVADQTGARVVALAHQVGSRDDATDYVATVDRNVRAVRTALDGQ